MTSPRCDGSLPWRLGDYSSAANATPSVQRDILGYFYRQIFIYGVGRARSTLTLKGPDEIFGYSRTEETLSHLAPGSGRAAFTVPRSIEGGLPEGTYTGLLFYPAAPSPSP